MPQRVKKDLNFFIQISIYIVILFGLNLGVNGWISEGNRVFYLDDLGCITDFIEKNNLLGFAFRTGGNKLRPVSMFLIGLVFSIAQGNYEIIDEVLLGINFLNICTVFYFAYRVQKNEDEIRKIVMSFLCAILYTISRFAYYNISEVYGIMEGIAVFFAITFLLELFLWLDSKENRYYYTGIVFYILAIWSHKRYFVLVFLFIVVLCFDKSLCLKKKIRKGIWPVLAVGTFWIIRFVLFGGRALDGTGGTAIGETFNIKTAIMFCFSQVGYILGFNCGPQYLNGITFSQVPEWLNIFLVLNLLIICCVVYAFGKILVKECEYRRENVSKIVLFILFIALCIMSSSITIRVEMRWIYVSYTAYVIFLVFIIDSLRDFYPWNIKKVMVLGLFMVLTLISECNYRQHYVNLYYWGEKDFSRAFYDATVKRYGNELIDKNIVIVSKSKALGNREEIDWKNFFKPYMDVGDLRVEYVDTINEAIQITNQNLNSIVLVEDVTARGYTDITDEFAETIQRLYGIYDDWWCEPKCAFEIYGISNRNVALTFYYPAEYEVIGTPTGSITINGENKKDFQVAGSVTTVEIMLGDEGTNIIEIDFDYWVLENTGRSEDGRLSSTLTVVLEDI
ncbi:MAG: hypothetical protein NC489_37565 [Ruminococcus flavefaciens]|nr:hypothetical protein [Ruminococcus flavefaciens]